MKRLRDCILAWARARQPDFVIGGAERPYLRRHWLIPRNPVFNVYVHEFLRSDDDRALHTHPWLFNCSWLLDGEYREWSRWLGMLNFADRAAGDLKFRWGPARAPRRAHQRILLTLFITGPRIRPWGFLCPQGFVHWQDFTDARDKGAVGKAATSDAPPGSSRPWPLAPVVLVISGDRALPLLVRVGDPFPLGGHMFRVSKVLA